MPIPEWKQTWAHTPHQTEKPRKPGQAVLGSPPSSVCHGLCGVQATAPSTRAPSLTHSRLPQIQCLLCARGYQQRHQQGLCLHRVLLEEQTANMKSDGAGSMEGTKQGKEGWPVRGSPLGPSRTVRKGCALFSSRETCHGRDWLCSTHISLCS